jgi:ribosomal protein S18 acetylase RimI-like enzyme
MTAISMRPAQIDDVPAIIQLLADDDLGRERESVARSSEEAYLAAFAAMQREGCNLPVVAVDAEGEIVGYVQLTFIPGLSHGGATRLQIEDVRVGHRHRRRGIGRRMIDWALTEARRRNCRIVQLFVHHSRQDAAGFYAALGFGAQHRGLRLILA